MYFDVITADIIHSMQNIMCKTYVSYVGKMEILKYQDKSKSSATMVVVAALPTTTDVDGPMRQRHDGNDIRTLRNCVKQKSTHS